MMRPDVIPKGPGCIPILPNMIDYGKTCESFSWEAVRSELLKGSIEKGINIAELAVDRHAAGMRANHVAIRWLGKNGAIRDLTFSDLHAETNRFANLLGALGTKKGERVFSLLGRVPELHVAALGTLKSGCIFCPLFAAFGPEPIRERLSLGDARVLVTTEKLYRKKIEPLRAQLPGLKHVLLVDADAHFDVNVWSMRQWMLSSSTEFRIHDRDGEAPALLHFTSGTTGRPKGAVHVHGAALMHV